MRKKIFLFLLSLYITIDSYSQNKLNPILEKLKLEIEKDTTIAYTTDKSRFNPSYFKFEFDTIQGEVNIIRIKIPEADYSDFSQDKEIRTVKLQQLDSDAITVDSTQYGYKFKIITKSHEKVARFVLQNKGQENVIMNDFINLGIHNFPDAKLRLQIISNLFKEAILISQEG